MNEAQRLQENDSPQAPWHRWGPYVSERQWGTVREDYSASGAAWDSVPHDHARSYAYRWGEDGIAGWSDRHGVLNVAPAFWNGNDPILKERFFGLSNPEGNHGEDVKECYWYLDQTPTHSYGRLLYKYPQTAFPYAEIVRRNAEADRSEPEVELLDLGVFDEDRYFDIEIEHAKDGPNAVAFRVTAHNRGPEAADLWVLPQVWFRNTWSWTEDAPRPELIHNDGEVRIDHPLYGEMRLVAEGAERWLFTENASNRERLYGVSNEDGYVKDAFHRFVVEGDEAAVNPEERGTKTAALFRLSVPAGGSETVRYALVPKGETAPDVDELMARRREEADAFYAELSPGVPEEIAPIQRQAFAGLLWTKQFYHYDAKRWLEGDPTQPPPPKGRQRNEDWDNVHLAEVMSMPDGWEYPWFAAWDTAFHAIPLAVVDPKFAKQQLILLLREWTMAPNGQIPAYEWHFSDVNPPVHAWAALRVYEIEREAKGEGDVEYLERAFHKLLLNFTWWVNRKDARGNNVFEGGFLGLDNIGVFDRSQPLPSGYVLEQSDATSWMAMFCLNMMDIALELAIHRPAYEDVASKFFEHFLHIATALNGPSEACAEIWHEEDGFYYDVLIQPDGSVLPNRIHSFVGLIPLFAVTTVEPETIQSMKGFRRRMRWFIENRSDLTCNVASMKVPGEGHRLLLAAVTQERLERILARTLQPTEFLTPHGIRSLSRFHEDHPFELDLEGQRHSITYEPAESKTEAFGGNSNWRGPVWFPLNYLLIESLQKFDHYYGDELKVNDPEADETTADGPRLCLAEVAANFEERLLSLFVRDENGRRPCNGGDDRLDFDPHWKDLVWFHEYFDGNTGKGLGASHQTGWTGLVAKMIQQLYVTAPEERPQKSIQSIVK